MKHFFSKGLAAVVLGMGCIASASALDLGAIQGGVTYDLVPDGEVLTATYTPAVSGKIKCEGPVEWFTDPSCAFGTGIDGNLLLWYPKTVEYEVVGGTTYYLYAGKYDYAQGQSLTIFEGAVPLKLSWCSPGEGSLLDFTNDQYIYFTFNQAPADGYTVKFLLNVNGSYREYPTAPKSTIVGNQIMVDVKNDLINLVKTGIVKPGATFKLQFVGLKSGEGALMDGEAVHEYSFRCGNDPVLLVSSKVPSKLMSYHVAGDPAAQYELVFNGDLMPSEETQAVIYYGDKEHAENPEDVYVEVMPITFDGAKLSVDFSGKLRTPETMLPNTSSRNFNKFELSVTNIKDSYGCPVGSEGQGTVGSYSYYLPYEIIPYQPVACEFTPEAGSTVNVGDEVEVYLTNLNNINLNGFVLTAAGQSVTVPVADCTFDGTATEGAYTFKVPAMASLKGLEVTADFVALDGYDHSADVRCVYNNGFVIVSSVPANGASLEVLKDGDIIKVEVAGAEKYPSMYIEYEIRDLNAANPADEVIKSAAWMNRQADGTYEAEIIFMTYKLLQGHDYSVVLTAWEDESISHYDRANTLGEDYFIIKGASLPFQYSLLNLESITPGEDVRVSAEDTDYTLSFDGMVNVTGFINVGMGATEPLESLQPVGGSEFEGKMYSNEWVAKVPASYMEGLKAQLMLSFQAYDMDGKILRGLEEGSEENSYYMFTWDCAGRYADFDVTLNGGLDEFESLGEVVCSSIIGINPSYTVANRQVYITNIMTGEKVATLQDYKLEDYEEETDDDGQAQGSDKQNTKVWLTFDNEVNTPGVYVLYIPENFFNIGSEFNQYNSNEKWVQFSIAGNNEPGDEVPFEVIPAEGNVSELSSLRLSFQNYPGFGYGVATMILPDGTSVNLPDGEYDDEDWYCVIQPLGDTYVEKGTYTVIIPKGYIGLGDWDMVEVQEITLVYTIGDETSGVVAIEAEDGVYNVYNFNGVKVLTTANAADLRTLAPGLYIINGVKVKL